MKNSGITFLRNRLSDPVEVSAVAFLDGGGDDFADLVRVVGLDKLGQFVDSRGPKEIELLDWS